MKRLFTVTLFFLATAFVAAQVTTMQLPPRPAPMGGVRDTTPVPTGTGVISGSITSIDGGRPMRRASVRLQMSTAPLSRTTTTDDRGNFEFKDLPAGEFTLRASKPGYLESIFGQKHLGSGRPGTPLSLKDGQHLEKVTLSIPKGGVLTGTIVDDVGEPAFGVPVRAMRYAFRNGERTLVSAGSTSTDDRGIYRIPTLVPGDYVVMATPIEDLSAAGDEMKALKEAMAVQGAARGANVNFTADVSRVGGPSDASPPSSGFAPVFFPSTTLAMSASTVALGPAEEKSGIDIQLQIVPLGTITGSVVGDTRAIQSTTIELSDSNTGLPGLSAKTARPSADGRFTFTGVAPGQYTLTAKSGGSTFVTMDQSGGQVRMTMMTQRIDGGPGAGGAGGPGGPQAPPMWAKADVSVEGRTKNDTSLVLQSGMSVGGRIAFDGTGDTPTDFSQMRVLLASTSQGGVMSGSSFGQVDTDGRFKITDVMPGKYRVTVTPPRGWRSKSIDTDGKDALDFMLDVKANDDVSNVVVTLTNKPAELSGVLQDSSGQPTSDYTIILFAAEQKYWTPQSRRILSTRPATDGRYTFRDLPPGDYKLVALDDAEPDSWFDPNVLRQLLVSSMSVTVVNGEKRAQDIKVNK